MIAGIMRHTAFAAALALLLAFPILAEDRSFDTGFRDLKWGDPLPSGMTQLTGDDTLGLYRRDEEKLSIRAVELDYIRYGFFKGGLYSVEFRTKKGQGPALLLALREAWGNPIQPDKSIERTIWSRGGAVAGYQENVLTGVGEVALFNVKAYEQAEAYKSAKTARTPTGGPDAARTVHGRPRPPT